MNKKGFLLGGSIVSLIITIGDLALVALIDDQFVTAGEPAAPTLALFMIHVAIKFTVGFSAFAIFILARNCQEALPLPPVLFAALITWLLVFLPAASVIHNLGGLALDGLSKMVVWGAIEVLIAIWAAAAVTSRLHPE